MTETVCPACKAPGGCPVEDGVTFHRQYPPPPPEGWRPSREDIEGLVARRLPSSAEASERLAEVERILAEVASWPAPVVVQPWDEAAAVVEELRGEFD